MNIGLVPMAGRRCWCRAGSGSPAQPRWRCWASGVGAPKALEWGLINRVWPDEELAERAEALAGSPRRRAPPAPTPAPSASSTPGSTPHGRAAGVRGEIQQELAGSADFAEGVAAFVEKREAARFEGR